MLTTVYPETFNFSWWHPGWVVFISIVIWYEAIKRVSRDDKNAIDKVFSIAKLYIEVLNAKKPDGKFKYKKPLRFVRFNEAGDFPNQWVLEAAARFAAFAKNYGIMCMAYGAKKQLDFTAIAEGTDEPIDKLIKIIPITANKHSNLLEIKLKYSIDV